MRESIIFYSSYFKALQVLPDEQFSRVMKSILTYAFNEEMPKLNGIELALFELIKPQIDANNKKYANGCKGGEFGKLGGRPKKTPEKPQDENKENPTITPEKPQYNPKLTPNENDNENENVNLKTPPIARAREEEFRTVFDAFVEEFDILVDTCDSRVGELDYVKLRDIYFKSSKCLNREKYGKWMKTLSWIVKSYQKIINGNYIDDAPPQKRDETIDILKNMWLEAKKEEG